MQLYRSWGGPGLGSNSVPLCVDPRDRSGDVFESAAAWTFSSVALDGDGRTQRLLRALVSAHSFETYGVRPALGRAFLPEEGAVEPGVHPVAVLGHAFRQDRFGGDLAILGRTVTLDGPPSRWWGWRRPTSEVPPASPTDRYAHL